MTAAAQIDLEQQLVEDIASFTHDPLGYVLYTWDWGNGELKDYPDGPDTWQREVLTEIDERLRKGEITFHEAILIAIASGHGIGKSALLCWIIKWATDMARS